MRVIEAVAPKAATVAVAMDDEEIFRVIEKFLGERFPGLAEQGITPETPLLDGRDIDSLGFLDIMMFLEERFGISVADQDFVPAHFENARTLCKLVQRKLG